MSLVDPLIIPCGGKSSRMGDIKGLLPYQGRPWLLYQMEQFSKVGGKSIIVVLGFHQEQFFSAVPWLSLARNRTHSYQGLDVCCLINPQPERGSFSSLQCGAEFLATGAFFLPVDVPVPKASVWKTLFDATTKGVDVVIPRWNQKNGHPVWLSEHFLKILRKLPADHPNSRLDFQIGALSAERQKIVEVDDKQILMNLNTAEDFLSFHRNQNNADKS